jgi:hypothetical protein
MNNSTNIQDGNKEISGLELEPSNCILFNQLENMNKTSFLIKNKTKKKISYEISTSFPNKMSFYPKSGMLAPYQHHEILGTFSFF